MNYDYMFISYAILVLCSIATYIWTFYNRYLYTSQVCAGDFISEHNSAAADSSSSTTIVLWSEMEDEFYLKSSGVLLKFFIVIESMFICCCASSSTMWSICMPNSFKRFVTPVETI